MCWVVSDNKHLIILEEGRMVVLEELGNLIPVSSSQSVLCSLYHFFRNTHAIFKCKGNHNTIVK